MDQTPARPLRCSRCNVGGILNALLAHIFTLYTCTKSDSFANSNGTMRASPFTVKECSCYTCNYVNGKVTL